MYVLTVGNRTFGGPAVDLRRRTDDFAVEAAEIVAAVRRNGAHRDRTSDPASDAVFVSVTCPDPGPVHEHVGHVRPSMPLDLRGALATAARSRGIEAPQRRALDEARERLDALSPAPVDLRAIRRRVADAGTEEQRLQERVASLRGRLQAFRETAPDAATAAADDLSEAVSRLSEVETERIAAEQRLEQARRDVREVRDARERRFALEDEVANLARAARRSLAAAVYDEFDDAVDAVPGRGDAGDRPGDYEGDPATAALAVVRIASVSAPIVLSVGRFDSAAAAVERLDAPAVRL